MNYVPGIFFLSAEKCPFVVVGHGVNDNVREPLLDYLRMHHASNPWLLYANLSPPYHRNPARSDGQRVYFKSVTK